MDFFNLRSPVVTSRLRQRQPDFTSFKHDKSPKCICAVEHLASTRQISQCCTRPGLDSCLYSWYIQYICVYLNIYIYMYVMCVCARFIHLHCFAQVGGAEFSQGHVAPMGLPSRGFLSPKTTTRTTTTTTTTHFVTDSGQK